MLRKIKADNEKLALLLGLEETSDGAWSVATYTIDKGFEELLRILKETGHSFTPQALDLELSDGELEFDGYGLCLVSPAKVKKIARELASATYEGLKAQGLAKQVTDYYGQPIPEGDYELYVGDIQGFSSFFRKAAADGHAVLVAQA
jgi:hypothetical protein